MKVENDMDYKIIADSCCDLTDEMKDWGNLALVPLTLELGDYRIMDDENFDQDDFIARMQALGDVPRSACPSPDAFCAAIAADDAKEVYVLTITDKLSGCYNSALQGVMLYEDDHPGEKKIHVFNSLATSGLETLIAYEIRRLKDGYDVLDKLYNSNDLNCDNFAQAVREYHCSREVITAVVNLYLRQQIMIDTY